MVKSVPSLFLIKALKLSLFALLAIWPVRSYCQEDDGSAAGGGGGGSAPAFTSGGTVLGGGHGSAGGRDGVDGSPAFGDPPTLYKPYPPLALEMDGPPAGDDSGEMKYSMRVRKAAGVTSYKLSTVAENASVQLEEIQDNSRFVVRIRLADGVVRGKVTLVASGVMANGAPISFEQPLYVGDPWPEPSVSWLPDAHGNLEPHIYSLPVSQTN